MNNKTVECPSPENPCMCVCHLNFTEETIWEHQCWECKMGKHKSKITEKSALSENYLETEKAQK